MSPPPAPAEVFDRAVEEGERRLDQPLLELLSTGFIAGFTIVFGVVALGIVEAAVEPDFGELARVAGALAFGVGVVLLVVGRVELFNENFFDPAAAAVESADSWRVPALLRLWSVTLGANLVGGCLFALVFAVPGTLPGGTPAVLSTFAEEIVARPTSAWFASAIAGGALVSLLSFLLAAVEGDAGRISMAYVVGVLLALGPFDHVVVTMLHLVLGGLFGAGVNPTTVLAMGVVVTVGNLVGGLGLVTVTHVTQALGARQ